MPQKILHLPPNTSYDILTDFHYDFFDGTVNRESKGPDSKMASTILLIDDDEKLNHLAVDYLINNGYYVEVETSGAEAVEKIIHQQPLLVILGIILPKLDGLSICRSVRPYYEGPILMLSTLDEDIDEVAGLETGADSYLVKPVRPRVLLAHIRALLRRLGRMQSIQTDGKNDHAAEAGEISHVEKRSLSVGELHIDAHSRSVYLKDKYIRLTSAEFDLLWLLASYAGRILNRNTIHRQLRGLDYDGVDRSIDLRISRIRKKLGDNSRDPRIIKSVRGIGYIFIQ